MFWENCILTHVDKQTSQNTENVLHLANNSSLDDKFSKVRPFFD